ncbi:hypothetical protein AOQ84DRAFT_22048 [Glonium stellatum]|uniref:Uncharacterized protein n=1 Tax=Glonium stellatum TaxID=574774 RepID=A0A8E2FCZ4_9PEZI|nr:hypothetical protein AOQ84DRAFT_22048 [Glonium stellatum]
MKDGQIEAVQMPQPKCVASTDEALSQTNVEESSEAQDGALRSQRFGTRYFRGAQWSPDGTCILTSDSFHNLRTFIVPQDILAKDKTHTLTPYASFASPEPIVAFVPYPGYSLQNPDSTLVLSSIRDHPIRLTNALFNSTTGPSPSSDFKSGVVAAYPLISSTERYVAPHSLAFTSHGTHFVAGSDSLISFFDVYRSHSGPINQQKTIPSRRNKLVGGGVGIKGIVSALSISAERTLAAGTLSRGVGLYADEGEGGPIAVFSVAHDKDRYAQGMKDTGGYGVTQVLWSPCARYLYVAERKSDVVLVYDIRVTGRLLGWLKGRKAHTNQRLGMDVVRCADGHEVWAGGVDGVARVWRNPGEKEGAIEADFGWEADQGPVSSTTVHSSGLLVATCSGERVIPRIT